MLLKVFVFPFCLKKEPPKVQVLESREERRGGEMGLFSASFPPQFKGIWFSHFHPEFQQVLAATA